MRPGPACSQSATAAPALLTERIRFRNMVTRPIVYPKPHGKFLDKPGFFQDVSTNRLGGKFHLSKSFMGSGSVNPALFDGVTHEAGRFMDVELVLERSEMISDGLCAHVQPFRRFFRPEAVGNGADDFTLARREGDGIANALNQRWTGQDFLALRAIVSAACRYSSQRLTQRFHRGTL